MRNILLVVHLLGAALALGGVVAAVLAARAGRESVTVEAARASRRALRAIVGGPVLTGLFLSLFTGVPFLIENRAWLRAGWLHAKLLLVLVALVSAHVDAIGMKRLVRDDEEAEGGLPLEAAAARAGRAETARWVTLAALLGALVLGAAKPF